MATYSRQLISGSTQGRGIKVAATATPGTTVHSTTTSATTMDEVWLYAHNSSGSSVELTLECGGVTSPDDLIKLTLPSKTGLTLVLPGITYSGSGSVALSIKAFAATANVIILSGYVNRAE